MLTRGQKAAATRKANAARRAAELRRQGYVERAILAWETRRANLRAKGLLTPDGKPTPKLIRQRRKTAIKIWETRRARAAEQPSAHA